ncbi:hypothetical protein NDU88_003165 [Pleurodeles waltl]|uniref:Uncharacterized protein n=1 Tax=Pleurodeles waltl TaxID=8319 RepID=A0AAV7KWQ9_PLEWA|nr:hypothetical protein NDU88_003165 [Pleurodeles waltl]
MLQEPEERRQPAGARSVPLGRVPPRQLGETPQRTADPSGPGLRPRPGPFSEVARGCPRATKRQSVVPRRGPGPPQHDLRHWFMEGVDYGRILLGPNRASGLCVRHAGAVGHAPRTDYIDKFDVIMLHETRALNDIVWKGILSASFSLSIWPTKGTVGFISALHFISQGIPDRT